MNFKLLATKCLFFSFFAKSICSGFSSSRPIPIEIVDDSIHFEVGVEEILSLKGMSSSKMLLHLLLGIDRRYGIIYNVKIDIAKDRKFLKYGDPNFDVILVELVHFHLQGGSESSERMSIKTFLNYFEDNHIQLVVTVTGPPHIESFSFLVEEVQLTPVPTYLLPRATAADSEDI